MGIESGPFRGSVAVQSGALSRHRLSRDYVRVFRDTYVPAGTTMDARTLAVAASVCVGNSAIVAGTSAAAMHGARWVDASVPPTVLTPKKSHRIPGLILRRDSIEPADVLVVGGVAVTNPVRTAFDIGRWVPPPQSVIFLDSLMAATGLELNAVSAFASLCPGCRGIRVLLDALGRVDGGAESPQETRTRLLLIDAGLPKPTTQIDIRDARGRFVARIDMGGRGGVSGWNTRGCSTGSTSVSGPATSSGTRTCSSAIGILFGSIPNNSAVVPTKSSVEFGPSSVRQEHRSSEIAVVQGNCPVRVA